MNAAKAHDFVVLDTLKMAPSVKIQTTTIQRLQACDKECTGSLIGIRQVKTAAVIGLFKCEKNGEEDVTRYLPAGVDVLGLFRRRLGSIDEEPGLDTSELLTLLPDDSDYESPYVITIEVFGSTSADSNIRVSIWQEGGILEETTYEIVPHEDIWKTHVLLSVGGYLSFNSPLTLPALETAFSNLFERIDKGCAFKLNDVDVAVSGPEVFGRDERSNVDELVRYVAKEKGKASRVPGFANVDCIEFGFRIITCKNPDDGPVNSLVIYYDKYGADVLRADLELTSIAMVPRASPLTALGDILTSSVFRNISLFQSVITQQVEEGLAPTYMVAKHFYPAGCQHFISLMLPTNKKDEELAPFRHFLHSTFLLPVTPSFLPLSSIPTPSSSPSVQLITPHHSVVIPKAMVGGETATVEGLYTYHHYMQDDIDDNGWGCAYRSLQTLASWLRFHGYSSKPIPSHKAIQTCLHELGDKPASFVGSRKWIGSTEVGYCLQSLLGVEVKFLNVGCGADMYTLGRQLLMHFQNQGSPIMIGGGVLAHTILGVNYESSTGKTWYLVLDPHYTGSDDLDNVIRGGWCAWKNNDFWDKKAFYNLCLPIRPKDVI